jgi:hypothetical protein
MAFMPVVYIYHQVYGKNFHSNLVMFLVTGSHNVARSDGYF